MDVGCRDRRTGSALRVTAAGADLLRDEAGAAADAGPLAQARLLVDSVASKLLELVVHDVS